MVIRRIGAAAIAFGWATGVGCSDGDRGESTVELPENTGEGGVMESPEFPPAVEGDSCCARLCRDLIDAGCSDLGTEDACVAALCPIPDALDEASRSSCLVAQGEALCCAWRVGGSECTGPPDPAGIGECASLAGDADAACSP